MASINLAPPADTTAPSAQLSLDKSTIGSGATARLTIRFSEAVKGFGLDDLRVTGGWLSDLVQSTVDPLAWTAVFRPNFGTQAARGSISLLAGSYTDLAGNAGTGATSGSFTVDTLGPTASITLDKSALHAGDTALVTIRFSEAVQGFDLSDVRLLTGTLGNLVQSQGDPLVWTATLAPRAGVTLGSDSVRLAATYTDLAGNAGSEAKSAAFAVDTTPPAASITVNKALLASGDTATVTIRFSEAVQGFDLSDLSASSGTLGNLVQSTVSPLLWTATLTPAAGVTTVANTVRLATTYTDAAGNAGAAATSNAYSVDTQAPTATITLDKSVLHTGDLALVTIRFSEQVKSFNILDLSASSGTLSSPVQSSADGRVWVASLKPALGVTSASNTVHLSADYTDLAGNAGTAATSASYAVDTVAPTATILMDKASLGSQDTATVTIRFSEAVRGFDLSDLSATTGTLGNLVQGTVDPLAWTATLTPAAGVASTFNTVRLATTYTDVAGNGGIAAKSAAYSVDTTAPTASITLDKSLLHTGDTALVTIRFSLPVTGFDLSDLSASSGTLGNLAQSNTDPLVWTATLTPANDVESAANTVRLSATYTSTAGKTGYAATSASYAVDTHAPTATLSLDKTALHTGDTATVTIAFSEAVQGFTLADLQASSGALSNLQQSAHDPRTWTATLTPTANVENASNTVTLATTYTDTAGNTGTAATSASYAVDTRAPTATITAARTALHVGESTTLSIHFSEDVGSSFTLSDLQAVGGSLSNLAGTGLDRTVTFTATAATGLSTHSTVSLADGTFTDLAGNAGQGASADIATAYNKVLFVGNSATFARVDPVMSYNTWNATTNPGGVHDLTSPDRGGTFTNLSGTNLYEPHNWGGVPGLVDAFADQVGLGYDVSISARNAATLKGQYLNSGGGNWDMRGNIASDKWDIVVLQDQTDEPLPGGTGSITFAAGSSTASLVVRPTGDTAQEYDETLGLAIAASSGYRVGTTATITGTILNDDPNAPASNPNLSTVTLVASPGSVAEDGNANLVYTFTRTGSIAADLTVNFTVFRDGANNPSVSNSFTATTQDLEMYNTTTGALITTSGSGSPYRFTSGGGFATSGQTGAPTTTGSVSFTSNTGTIVIKAGQTQASLTLDPHADTNLETDESIRITLAHPTTGTDYNIGTQGAVYATIVNDDFAPGTDTSLPNVTLAMSSAATVYENAGQDLVYTFTRSGSTTAPLTVNFTETGTATYFSSSPSSSDFAISSTGTTGTTTLVTQSGSNADTASFEKYATLIEDYIHTGAADTTTVPGTTIAANPNANAEADVYLYATWARPDMIAGAYDMLTDKTQIVGGPNDGAYTGGTISQSSTQATAYYLRLEDMSTDLTNAYQHLAQVNHDFVGVAPVSTAFMNAVTQGLAIRNPYTDASTSSVTTGKVDLWFTDNLHASKYGSYLAGLTLFQTITGLDSRVLGKTDKVAADLGIDQATAVALQGVAAATAGFSAGLHWTAPGIVADMGGTNEHATLATAGAYSFVDPAYTQHGVVVTPAQGTIGTLVASVRSDGHAGQVNWTYQVDNAAVDALLGTGQQRQEQFSVALDDGHGHVDLHVIGVTLVGSAPAAVG